MESNQHVNSSNPPKICNHCHKAIIAQKIYHYKALIWCERCCMNAGTSRQRKTHWQYIRSIKSDYLIPGGKG